MSNINKYDLVRIKTGEYEGKQAVITQVLKSGLLIMSVMHTDGTPSIRLAKKHIELIDKYTHEGFWPNAY